MRRLVACIVLASLAGCMTYKGYDGRRLPPSDLARVEGDYKMRASPVSVLLRQVDGRPVDIRYSGVDLLPGAHSLLFDCVINGVSASRHRVNVDLLPGVRYVIVADTSPGNRECTNVRLQGGRP